MELLRVNLGEMNFFPKLELEMITNKKKAVKQETPANSQRLF